MRKYGWTLLILLAVALTTPFGLAQTFTGTIRGTVTDQTGAAIPAATVTATDVNTGLTRKMNSGPEGEFEFSSLAIGVYRVGVIAKGFTTEVKTGLDLHVNDIKLLSFKLAVGSGSEEVTVEANSMAVETQTGQVAGLVEGTQVRELPMNGRNFMQLTQLTPGVAAGAGAAGFNATAKGLGGSVNMTVSGSSGNGNLWLVDGANNNDYGSNRTILVNPSIDNIAEFKILRNSYGPEFGQAAGGVINIVTRSGSNQFHGSAYYFGRNDALNARDWFLANANQPIGKLRRNDYGFTFGGPIKKDKLFFFYSEEWNRENRGFTRTGTVPTLQEKSGIFAGGCHSQSGLVGLPNLTTLNPAGVAYLKIFPDPNVNPGCNPDGTLAGPNWISSVPSKTDWREDSIRADYNITPRQSLMVRFSNDSWQNPYPNADPFYGLWGNDPFPAIEGGWSQPSRSLSTKLTSTFGSSVVNDIQFSYSHNNISTTLGGDQSLLQAIDQAIPVIYKDSKFAGSLPAYPTVWGSPYGNLWEESPWANKQDLYSLKDNVSFSVYKHLFKAGFVYGTNAKNENLGGGAYAEAVTLGSTSQFVSDLLTPGKVFGFSENEKTREAKVRWHDMELYFGDSFRVHPRLTLEYVIRWSLYREPFMEDDTIASFSPAAFNPAISSPCNGLLLPSGSKACTSLGFAGAVTADNRSLRQSANNLFAPRLGFAFDPTGSGKWAIRGGIGQFFQRERVNALLGLGSNPPFLQSTSGSRILNSASTTTPGNSFAIGYGNPGYGIETTSTVPNTWQWNLTLEREVSRNTKLEASYVGSHGVHLLSAYNANQYRNFTGLGDIWMYGDHGGSIYHSLQMAYNGRMGRNLQFQTAYTYSKLISDSSMNWFGEIQNGKFDAVTDIKRPWLDRGNSEQNRPHVFAANLVYNLPTLQGQNGLLKHTFGNWEAATIVTAGTGSSVSVFQGGSTSIRPNLVAGQSCQGTGSPIQIINPAAFSLIPDTSIPGVTGNAPRGVCQGPGYANADLAFYKNFGGMFKGSKFFSEGAKIQFRLEMFNAFNHPQFQFSGSNLDFTSNGFGRATRTTGGREIQYALKLLF